ncbi:hypothetical protein D3C71_1810660 [compost metagenome]
MQLLAIGQQPVGHGREALGGFFHPQAVFDAVKTDEIGAFFALLVVVGPCVDALVQVCKQLGNGFDALIGAAHLGVELLGFFDLAGLDGVGEGLHAFDEFAQIGVDV